MEVMEKTEIATSIEEVRHQGYTYTNHTELNYAVESPRATKISLKCGDTINDITDRIKAQQGTGNSSPTRIIGRSNWTHLRDYEFHKFLESKGIYKTKDTRELRSYDNISDILNEGSEWFDFPFKIIGWKKPNANIITNAFDKEIQSHKLDLIECCEKFIQACYEEWLGEPTKNTFEAGLIPSQHELLYDVFGKIGEGIKTFLWHVCPRGQKTKLTLMLALSLECRLTIVCSYVLSVFTSYINDCAGFSQTFDKFVIIDTNKDDNWIELVYEAWENDKSVLLCQSLCGGEKTINVIDEDGEEITIDKDEIASQTEDQRKERMKAIKDLPGDKLFIVEEADLGAHRVKQFNVMTEARTDDDLLVIQTGTNPERAVSNWPVEYTAELLYTEMVQDKKNLINGVK